MEGFSLSYARGGFRVMRRRVPKSRLLDEYCRLRLTLQSTSNDFWHMHLNRH
jgi:hypothetical protein